MIIRIFGLLSLLLVGSLYAHHCKTLENNYLSCIANSKINNYSTKICDTKKASFLKCNKTDDCKSVAIRDCSRLETNFVSCMVSKKVESKDTKACEYRKNAFVKCQEDQDRFKTCQAKKNKPKYLGYYDNSKKTKTLKKKPVEKIIAKKPLAKVVRQPIKEPVKQEVVRQPIKEPVKQEVVRQPIKEPVKQVAYRPTRNVTTSYHYIDRNTNAVLQEIYAAIGISLFSFEEIVGHDTESETINSGFSLGATLSANEIMKRVDSNIFTNIFLTPHISRFAGGTHKLDGNSWLKDTTITVVGMTLENRFYIASNKIYIAPFVGMQHKSITTKNIAPFTDADKYEQDGIVVPVGLNLAVDIDRGLNLFGQFSLDMLYPFGTTSTVLFDTDSSTSSGPTFLAGLVFKL